MARRYLLLLLLLLAGCGGQRDVAPRPTADHGVPGAQATAPLSPAIPSSAPPAATATVASGRATTVASGRTATPTPLRTVPPPPAGQVYWGLYTPGVPWDMRIQDALEDRLGRRSSVIHWGQAWELGGEYQPFYPNDFERVRARGAIPMIDWGSWDYTRPDAQPEFRLAAIARGDHDAYIERWAAGARDWGHPFFLRFDWEMNGWWKFPWSEQLNGNQPGDYVRAWRHVRGIFARVGATNATWVWAPNVVLPDTVPLASLYPGDAYVDWVAMDGYNYGVTYGNRWQSFDEIFNRTYLELLALAPGKPIMLAEIGCAEAGGSKADWIRDAFEVQLAKRYTRIRAVVWFDWDDNDPLLTFPVDSSPEALAAFASALRSDRYVNPSSPGTGVRNP